jgi:hypothetical protein
MTNSGKRAQCIMKMKRCMEEERVNRLKNRLKIKDFEQISLTTLF